MALVESAINEDMNMSVYFSLVDIYLIKQNLDRAEFYNEKVGQVVPHPYEVQVNYGYYLKKGHINYRRDKFREAFDDYRQAYGFALKGGHRNSISASLRALSNTALKLNNSEAAKSYAMQNLALAEEINTKTARMEALMNLSNYYNKTGNTQKAYELLEQAMLIKDSLLSETNVKQVNVLAAIYESEKQQKEILVLQNEKEMQAESVKQKKTRSTSYLSLPF